MGSRPRPANPDFDPEALRRTLALIRATLARYFRLHVSGGENLPAGRCLVVGCHSGVMPYDAALALVAIEDATGRLAHSIGDHLWGRIGAVDRFLRRHGAVVGNPREATALLREGHIVLVMPGGAADMTRPIWRDAYRVLPHKGWAPGRGGYLKVALRTRSPIIPMAVVGAEETHMLLFNLPRLARLLGFPFFPVVASPVPLPTRIYIRFGEPIRFPFPPSAARDQQLVDRLNREVRRELQRLIDDTLARRRGLIFSDLAGD